MHLLHDNPLLLLFVVAALGTVLGSLTVRGFNLGVAAVLFAGLGVNAWDPALSLPPFVQELGLVLFVYAVGLGGGPVFFASFQKRGLRDASFTVGLLTFAGLLAVLLGRALLPEAASVAGTFCGALTNTPALAAVVQFLGDRTTDADALAAPVVAYSLAYPLGVLGVLLVLELGRRFAGDTSTEPSPDATGLVTKTVRVTSKDAVGKPAEALREDRSWEVVFSRLQRAGELRLVDPMTVFEDGDLVAVVGTSSEVERVASVLGAVVPEAIELDRSKLDFRRIFVTSPDAVGKTVRELGLMRRFGASATRVRRGDVELLADEELVLLPGDRVRVVAPREKLPEISKFLGDRYSAVGELDLLTVGVGIALGLLAGHVDVPLPGGLSFTLGLAGGPLVAGLVLGRLGRTGPLVWAMPYSANVTLRQFGLVLFFAGVGTRSGAMFAAQVQSGGAASMVLAGALVTVLTAALALVVGLKLLKVPMPVLSGMVAALHTQPAALAFAMSRYPGEAPNQGYAAVFPLATIAKIVAAQLLVSLT